MDRRSFFGVLSGLVLGLLFPRKTAVVRWCGIESRRLSLPVQRFNIKEPAVARRWCKDGAAFSIPRGD